MLHFNSYFIYLPVNPFMNFSIICPVFLMHLSLFRGAYQSLWDFFLDSFVAGIWHQTIYLQINLHSKFFEGYLCPCNTFVIYYDLSVFHSCSLYPWHTNKYICMTWYCVLQLLGSSSWLINKFCLSTFFIYLYLQRKTSF